MNCNNCGKPNPKSTKFCSDCGYELGKQRSVADNKFSKNEAINENSNQKLMAILVWMFMSMTIFGIGVFFALGT